MRVISRGNHHRVGICLTAVIALTFPATCFADPAAAIRPADAPLPAPAAPSPRQVSDQVRRAHALLEAEEPASLGALREAAASALALLQAQGTQLPLSLPLSAVPIEGPDGESFRQAAQAHLWWGQAALRWGSRDEGIMALARAVRLAGDTHLGNNLVARDCQLALNSQLHVGLPLWAADDTLETIAAVAHGGLWKPRRVSFGLPGAPGDPLPAGAVMAQTEPAQFLITSGKLYPPMPLPDATDASLNRVPPLYRTVSPDALPPALNMDRMMCGFVRQAEGPNRGLWHQIVKIYYASPYLTKDQRDDAQRAETLCLQFLRVHEVVRASLGLENLYSDRGLTTLWLNEPSSWWPLDDDDPLVQAALGVEMPDPNTPLGPHQAPPAVIKTTPLTMPWRAAGQDDAAPGEIMFFRMTQPRDEAEWLREMAHEYGHVALPPFGGFQPPLEPYGNGLVGETLTMLWAAAAPREWSAEPGAEMPLQTLEELRGHVARHALSSLQYWNTQGPLSPQIHDEHREGLVYLEGACVFLERVYGSRLLGDVLRPLAVASANARDKAARLRLINTQSLLDSVPHALHDPFRQGTTRLPVWLGAALRTPASAVELVDRRAPVFRRGEQATGWIYVPGTASYLGLEWKETPPVAVAANVPPAPNIVRRFDMRGQGGWRTLKVTAPVAGQLVAAWFEKTPPPPVPARAQ